MHRKHCLLVAVVLSLALFACSEQNGTERQRVFEPAGDVVTLRPIHEFVQSQGTGCVPDGFGGCVAMEPPVPNYVCWCDPGAGLMASMDYATVAGHWIERESGGQVVCGADCRGRVLEVPQPDGSVRLSVIVETKSAITWAEKSNPRPIRFGNKPDRVLRGADPVLGYARLEVEFTMASAGEPLPDLMNLLYAPAPGQQVKSIKFHGKAIGIYHGKRAVLEITQQGLPLSQIPASPLAGIPARITLTKERNRYR